MAVPQGAGQVSFTGAGPICRPMASSAPFGNDWGFTVSRIAPDSTEIINQQVSYHWENGGFKLYFYMDRDIYTMNWYAFDDSLRYEEFRRATSAARHGHCAARHPARQLRHAAQNRPGSTEKLSLAPDIRRAN